MKTIRVIDLLNKIVNGEIETFYKFQYRNKIVTMEYLLDNYLFLEILNDEIEIIEGTPKEDKKIEKLIIYDDAINWCCNGKAINDTEKDIIDKINEIIDRLNGEDNE